MIIYLRFVGQIDDRIGEAKIRRFTPSSLISIRDEIFQTFFYNSLVYFCSMRYIQVGVPGFGIFVGAQLVFPMSAVSGVLGWDNYPIFHLWKIL